MSSIQKSVPTVKKKDMKVDETVIKITKQVSKLTKSA